MELEGLVTYGTRRTQDFHGFSTGQRQHWRRQHRGIMGSKGSCSKKRGEERRVLASDQTEGCSDVITKSS